MNLHIDWVMVDKLIAYKKLQSLASAIRHTKILDMSMIVIQKSTSMFLMIYALYIILGSAFPILPVSISAKEQIFSVVWIATLIAATCTKAKVRVGHCEDKSDSKNNTVWEMCIATCLVAASSLIGAITLDGLSSVAYMLLLAFVHYSTIIVCATAFRRRYSHFINLMMPITDDIVNTIMTEKWYLTADKMSDEDIALAIGGIIIDSIGI